MNFKALIGITFALIAIACFNYLIEKSAESPSVVTKTEAEAPVHHHHHEAPHGGCLIVLGNEFAHLEITLDQSNGFIQLYMLDGMAIMGTRIQQTEIELKLADSNEKVTLKAQVNPLSGETVGDSSLFSAQSKALIGKAKFKAEIPLINIKGISFKNIEVSFPEGNEH